MSEKNNQKGSKSPAPNEGDKIIPEQSTIFDYDEFIEKIRKFKKCVCKLKIATDNITTSFGTGFFCYIPSKNFRVLITNNHLINDDFLKKENELKLYFQGDDKEEEEKIINLKSRRMKFTDVKLDFTAIEIIDEDLIDNSFEVDEELIKDNEFINESIFNMQFPKGGHLKGSIGKIIKSKKDKIRFIYDAGTEAGSSGSPIILTDGFKIIGLHSGTRMKNQYDYDKKKNIGIYLNKIISLIPNSPLSENKNIIKCLYEIKKEDVNKDIKVYDNKNNFGKAIKSFSIYREDEKKRELNDGKCRFEKEGKYFIFYYLDKSFKDLSNLFDDCNNLIKVYMPSFSDNEINNMSKMFNNCSSLKKINFLSSFKTENVLDMSGMFSSCIALENINLSSFNTKNVNNTSKMFSGCESLTKIDLSSFNTEKVTDMSDMFARCKHLKEINLSSFNTEKVEDMSNMFQECNSLREINLSSFNTNSVSDLSNMFEECRSLTNLDLSNFNVINVLHLKKLFKNCHSLKEIDLTNFKVNNTCITRGMFLGCTSLKSIKGCTDKKILKEYEQIIQKNN